MTDLERSLATSLKDLQDVRYALDQSAIVATTNVRGDITYVNDKFCEISGYSREELLGANHRLLNSGLHPVEFFKNLYHEISNGRVWRGEIRNRAKDGHFYWVDTTIVPYLDDAGRPFLYTAIRYDITERKRSEETLRRQEALAQVGRMAAVVAHEVRNPLAGIRGALQVIGRRLPAGTAEAAVVDEIVARIDALDDIVGDLLQFARPRAPVLKSVDGRAIVEDTLALVRNDPRFAGAAIVVDLPEMTLLADGEQIKQVLLNLVLNAIQATDGSQPIRIEGEADGDLCTVVVVDRGRGIAPDVRARLFEPFFTTKSRGTGLGLATARRILDAHGGSIHLECPPEGGTRAVVRLKQAVRSPAA